MGHSGIYILIHFYDSAAKYIWSIGNKINDGHKAVAVLTLNNLLFDVSLLLLHDATSISTTAPAQRRRVKRKWQPLSSWPSWASRFCVACFQSKRLNTSSAFDTGEARGAIPRDRMNGTMWGSEWWRKTSSAVLHHLLPLLLLRVLLHMFPSDWCLQMGGRLKMLPEMLEHWH